MIKQFILVILASVAAIFFQSEIVHALNILVLGHTEMLKWFGTIFSNDRTGRIIVGVIALVIIPVLVASIVSIVYFLVKKRAMPFTATIGWVLWTVLLTTMLAQAG